MSRIAIANWNSLKPETTVYALVINVDLVIVRWPREVKVSVLYGRCLYRETLLADGEIENDCIISLHGWRYRYDSGLCVGTAGKQLHLFKSWLKDGFVWVDEDEITDWEQQHPQALTLLDDFYEQANRVDSPQSTQSKTSFSFKPYLPVISIAGLGLVSMLGWQVYPHRVPQPAPATIDTAILLKQLQTNKATDETYEQLAQLANEAENVNAQQWVGYRYLVGNGVKPDLPQAKQWYQKAAAQASASTHRHIQGSPATG